jgi:CheY-like chemotaxis protein
LDSRTGQVEQRSASVPGAINDMPRGEKGISEGAKRGDARPVAASERRRTTRAIVLLVDDDEFMRAITADILTGLGYDVLEAADGEAALAVLNTGSPIDLMLTDVVMTGMSGPELAHRVRALHPSLPIVFITGYAELGSNNGDQHPHQLIRKPFRPADLRTHIEAALMQSRTMVT